ncbi:carbohydrate ABC transporter membrane protein 2 (CUT1 family) [Frigoribacterium sp. PhB160]|uniref:carbohydrate ABC transporter permease n=1 Tax=Frigoribacterium sp. PhB160 TaxID=2485192 RepID=UPI000F4965D5|nr:carbohydrate ABC transporter permease [Frigoribacterium sp. PhB160]ROS61544.1 carbohydrate ABC transporter membrane protein 2 (CUT1 family) [Frigoribacterium sp. PhB160]
MARTKVRRGWRRWINVVNLGGVLIAAVTAIPLYWLVVSSFKTSSEVAASPPTVVPQTWTLENYVTAFVSNDLAVYMLNSVIVAVSTTVLVLGLALFAGYALTGRKLKGGTGIMTTLLMLSVFPAIAVLTPIYLIERQLGLLNSYPGLIIPYVAFNLPFAIWIMRNYLAGIPTTIEEASEIDGASPLRTVFSVILPMSKPGLFTVGVFTFTASWSEFLMALTFNSETSFRTIPVGIALFGTQFTVPYGAIFAASVSATVPIVLLVLIFRRSIVSGLTSGAVKG